MVNYPYLPSKVYFTQEKTPYLKEAGVHLISAPLVELSSLEHFFSGFPEDLAFQNYLKDSDDIPSSCLLSKFAGQLCYNSFGPKRTYNKDSEKYFTNIKISGHGSVLEHACFTFLFYGVSRSLTHELVRHRAGFSFSQVSQRYVNGPSIRFVERPEYSSDTFMHTLFEQRIDVTKKNYEALANYLSNALRINDNLYNKTSSRKVINQCARSLLTNEVEAPIVVTANIRAWRHFIELRATSFADVEIRNLAVKVFNVLNLFDPIIFSDYKLVKLEDGSEVIETSYRKV